MSIRKKGNRWEVRLSTGGGNRLEQRLPNGATRADAKALEAALERRLIESATGRINYTIGEAITRWEPDAKKLRSWQKDLRYRVGVVRDLVGYMKLTQLPDAAIIIKRRGTQLKAAGVNRYLAVLKRIGSIAWKAGWLDQPIAERIELLPGEVRRTVFANPAQIKRLMIAADERVRDLMVLSVLTGLRRGELMQLSQDMIVGDDLVLPPEITKTAKPRIVPLNAQALEIAARRIPVQLSTSNLTKLWNQARIAAGVPELRWHDLRRTFGTMLLQNGASLADARDLLGHGDVRTTSIYLATGRQDLRRAVELLPVVGENMGTPKKRLRRKTS